MNSLFSGKEGELSLLHDNEVTCTAVMKSLKRDGSTPLHQRKWQHCYSQILINYLIPANILGDKCHRRRQTLAVSFFIANTVFLTPLINGNGNILFMYGNIRWKATWKSLLERLLYKQYLGVLGNFYKPLIFSFNSSSVSFCNAYGK